MARISPLVAAELIELPCPYCGRQLPAGTDWLVAAQSQWGRCGVKLSQDGQVVGILALAPGEERGQGLVKAIWVRPEVSGRGYGRQLVQGAAADMVRLKLDVLLAAGGRTHLACATPPSEFLAAVGFVRPADSRLWRLELHRAVLERSGLGLLGRLLRGLGSGPEPAGGAVSSHATRSGR
ncbi:GNAT family N-acetyltransferase [Propionicimonas sp.]|uniref:GNAT family N-acetyltransferase n=1 Tax=Propionicimonas sp. TaxID=1955623 RepID=UPI0017E2772A|nr:GNAT family N-acetyltransferase [Propionicimonas sp.]MBU3976352.1 GNAT family N-acetyltransferase [Actinomycetota bacterium]MBA3022055.1 GNAT family N-acetyltransferase [Propionicimonas sp.]MBU3987509.1 GNAT family N-acetyltransferase [Actinomycetota bacterium]MBU4006546.1 GNAT family N-acetyltransferase [Actinomycetota bacterium]MBU4065151.1 GNAT family N-acetyltransferase [Actinomycetota bacterium]